MPLTKEELEIPRSAAEMLPWALAACERFNTKELRAAARMGKHFAREFMDEALPIARFANQYYGASDDVIISHVLGNQNYDAVVEDRRTSSGAEQFIEATTTLMTYEESLRMELLNRDGHAPAFGGIKAIGPKHARVGIEAERMAREHGTIVKEHLDLVAQVVGKKAGKTYQASTALIVAVDDLVAFREPVDVAMLDALVRTRLHPMLAGTQFCLLALQGGAGLHLCYRI